MSVNDRKIKVASADQIDSPAGGTAQSRSFFEFPKKVARVYPSILPNINCLLTQPKLRFERGDLNRGSCEQSPPVHPLSLQPLMHRW